MVPISLLKQAKFSPFLVQIVPTRQCNLTCGYCNEYSNDAQPVPVNTMKERIKKIWELGTMSIEFSGGEPLLHPDIYTLIKYSTDLKFVGRMLITNGFLLSKDAIEKLNEVGLTHIQISIDGVTANDTTVKTLKSLRKKLELVSRYGRFKTVVNSVIGAAPPTEVLEVVNSTEELGFIPRVLVVHGDSGQIKLSSDNLQLYNSLKNRIKKRLLHGSSATDDLIAGKSAFFKCRGGARYLYVDEYGDVSWCSQQRNRWKKPLMEYTADDLKNQFYQKKACEDYCSIGCVRTCSQLDGGRKYGK